MEPDATSHATLRQARISGVRAPTLWFSPGMKPTPEELQQIVDEVYAAARKESGGEVASYIPELGKADANHFGISICDLDGGLMHAGDTDHPFTIQSISKVITYACALETCDREAIDQRVDIEPTGEDFDSIIKLDRHQRPFNPMVNAGAIAITDLLLSRFGKDALGATLEFYARLLGRADLEIDEKVFNSEVSTGKKNLATANLLKHFSLLDNEVDDVIELYCRHCSVLVTAVDLARLGANLARAGGHGLFSRPDTCRHVLSVMMTCGMYNDAGQWALDVGYPAKSGISGGMTASVPGRMGVGVFSPPVNELGSSVRGWAANRLISSKLGLHLFTCKE